MEGRNKELLPNKEFEKIETSVHTTKDVDSTWTELEVLDARFDELLGQYGWDDDNFLRVKLSIAFREALINAVIHGNYGVGKISTDDNVIDLAKAKVAGAAVNIPPEVKVSINVSREVVGVTIQDMGQGFDLGQVADPLEEKNLMKSSGRGITLMREAFTEVNFSGPRNQIVKLKNTRV